MNTERASSPLTPEQLRIAEAVDAVLTKNEQVGDLAIQGFIRLNFSMLICVSFLYIAMDNKHLIVFKYFGANKHFYEKRTTQYQYCMKALINFYRIMNGHFITDPIIPIIVDRTWTDKRLTWNATEKGVEVFAPEHDIWRPHITEIRDRGFDGEPIYHPHGKTEKINPQNIQSTVVRSDGDVTSVHTFRLTAKCIANLMKWPRDTSTCEGFIGSEAIQNLNLTTYHHADGYIFSSYMESEMEDWMLLNISETKLDLETPKNGFDQIINFTLELGTTGNIFTRLLIFPGIGSLVITLAMLVLKFDNNIRLFTLGTSFIIHTYLLQILAFHMPPCGSQPPYLVKYFANSLIITGLIVVETIAVKSISTLKQMSKLAVAFLRYLEICKIFDLLLIPRKQISNGNFLGDLNQGESTTKIIIEEKSWETIALLLDRLMLFTVILAYFYNIVHFLVF